MHLARSYREERGERVDRGGREGGMERRCGGGLEGEGTVGKGSRGNRREEWVLKGGSRGDGCEEIVERRRFESPGRRGNGRERRVERGRGREGESRDEGIPEKTASRRKTGGREGVEKEGSEKRGEGEGDRSVEKGRGEWGMSRGRYQARGVEREVSRGMFREREVQIEAGPLINA